MIFALPREKNGFNFLIIVRLLRTLALHAALVWGVSFIFGVDKLDFSP